MKNNTNNSNLPDLNLSLLNLQPTDTLTQKLLMLVEGIYGLGVKHSIKKYDYTEQRYYQLYNSFKEFGSDGLLDKKRGPHNKSKRTEIVIQQIIRLKFLDPQSSSTVISQKLNQMGYTVSIRSVERTITQYGLLKKNSTS